jgi:hypothetical protein
MGAACRPFEGCHAPAHGAVALTLAQQSGVVLLHSGAPHPMVSTASRTLSCSVRVLCAVFMSLDTDVCVRPRQGDGGAIEARSCARSLCC